MVEGIGVGVRIGTGKEKYARRKERVEGDGGIRLND